MRAFSKITITLCVFLAIMLFAVGPVSALVQMENIDPVPESTLEYQQSQDVSIEGVVGTGTVANAPTETDSSADDLACGPDPNQQELPSQKPIADFTMPGAGESAEGRVAPFTDESQFANYVIIDFGDGERPQGYNILEAKSGIMHIYPLSMTHTYKVTYTAYNQLGQSSKVATIYV